ncbi:MAG TPA: NAD(P)/FAD-dependent oxidoreductase [Acidimicrobiales bacterium]|jgi:cyclohexanone monooxygenase|nr:NAD(P)/FAD-dependent oxidoreductase [Acidimicrobiales bacterium]
MADVDIDALREKYAAERLKRLRPDGNDQYIRVEGQLSHYLDDPYTPVADRPPRFDHVSAAVIGGGFAGLLTAARLKEAGMRDVRLIDKAGDVGGTWYWNRYPGAQCDTASFVYMPLLEETSHMPSEKYAHGPEILEHCRRIAHAYDLYDDALFHTEVTELRWDEPHARWTVTTNRGDAFTAQYVVLGTGPLHVPKLPGIPGIESFRGHSFHTSRWDYGYTGGSPLGEPMDLLSDKRVAVIGTGATSVQCVPHLARSCRELYVFQRTPSSVDARGNAPTDPEWFKQMATAGWQQRWMENFASTQTGRMPAEDLVQDGWTDLAQRIRQRIMAIPQGEVTPEAMMDAFEESDYEKMEEIRARVDAIVEDSSTAAGLKAWYRQLCKRPCFHDEYLQAFNVPRTHLVDTDGAGVERIDESGVVVAGQHYDVDCIIFASGFEVGTPFWQRAGFDMVGRDGITLSEHWSDGMRTLHGIHTHGFPNAFIVQITQGANLLSNVPHNLSESANTIATILDHAQRGGFSRVEVTKEAEDQWMDLLRTGVTFFGSADCTPGYYNNEGQPNGRNGDSFRGYPLGAVAYFEYIEQWRNDDAFDGLRFSS